MILKAMVIKRSGVPCPNGLLYTDEDLMVAVNQINEKTVFGGLGYNSSVPIDLLHVSHRLTNARFVDGEMIADVVILETPKGKHFQDTIKAVGIGWIRWAMTIKAPAPVDGKYSLPLEVVSIDAVPNEA